jgi:hypothetical protein
MNKEHIIAEIRRTAELNAGVPLGRLVFFNETGIKESDWKGRFFASSSKFKASVKNDFAISKSGSS